MLRNPAAYRDRDFVRAALERGWILDRVRGSHQAYVKLGWPVVIPIPRGVEGTGTKRAIVRALMEEESRGA